MSELPTRVDQGQKKRSLPTDDVSSLRLCVRVEVGSHRKQADMALPASSCVAEMLDEVIQLMHAPTLSGSWEVVTAAGSPLDAHEPLNKLGLRHGDVIVIRPSSGAQPPVIRDAAEALAHSVQHSPFARGTASCACLVGVALLCGIGAKLPFPPAVGLSLAAMLAVGLAIWSRAALFIPSIAALVAGIVAVAVLGPAIVPSPEAIMAGLNAETFSSSWSVALSLAGVAAIICAALFFLLMQEKAHITATIVVGIALSSAGFGAFIYRPSATDSATPDWQWLYPSIGIVVTVMLIFLSFGPQVVAKMAGLKVPQLPTAGQELSVSDIDHDQIPAKSAAAQSIARGLVLGVGLSISLSMVVASISIVRVLLVPHAYLFWFALCVWLALVLHAHRHRSALDTWALWIPAQLAIVCATLAAAWLDNPWLLGLCALVALLMVSSLLWANRIPTIEPTTVVWIERAEALAIAACIPLALQVAGIFAMIRGLSL
ncbi:MAG: type VII secretion integral membrane protein EccD [Corynebacterium sp.]|uniref:type VII secretion integral membrane protein EccD n=1 Tax=Corynebacterium sp. TaxID=1720 RepID=UPI0026DCCF54|nr:type VII secretion integral membrane protein EccD [Corynebacterium sp.]MDO4760824.1 type VII secretion integral membrane protein EccD [Corynebacterium sp.]